MSTVTPYLNLVKPAPLENFSRATYNTNLDLIDAEALLRKKAKNARFSMIAVKTGAPAGNGITLGPLQIDPTKPLWQSNNDFCVVDNTPDNTAGSTGRIRITKAGIYNISGGYIPSTNPGNMNWALTASGDKITMNRIGVYGDWEAVVSANGIYMAVGAFIEGYQANSGGVNWFCWINVTYVGEI